METLDNNEAWDVVELLVGRNPNGRKWVFNKKLNEKGKVEKHKAHLVAKRYYQVEEIDFGDILYLIAKLTSSRFILYVGCF
jgi:hypothetical protein